MSTHQPIWILINCNSIRQAQKIGTAALDKRLASCFDVFKRELATYFWPPKSSKKESVKGALLIIETLESKYKAVSRLVTKLHSDDLPFIGYISIQGINPKYLKWIKAEVK